MNNADLMTVYEAAVFNLGAHAVYTYNNGV